MSWLHTLLILAASYVAVFWEAAFPGIRRLLGAQIDLLPPLMVYAALRSDLATVSLLAVLGGLWFDSLSATPLGVSVLPLFLAGVTIFATRELILREQPFAHLVLGFAASVAVPVLTLILLLTETKALLLGWGTVWQLIVMAAGGAAATPISFLFFEWLLRILTHARPAESSFRPDREIRRGRL